MLCQDGLVNLLPGDEVNSAKIATLSSVWLTLSDFVAFFIPNDTWQCEVFGSSRCTFKGRQGNI